MVVARRNTVVEGEEIVATGSFGPDAVHLPGIYVNLGTGLPTLVANFVDPAIKGWLQSKDGILGIGPFRGIAQARHRNQDRAERAESRRLAGGVRTHVVRLARTQIVWPRRSGRLARRRLLRYADGG